jgi:hypothetical protein
MGYRVSGIGKAVFFVLTLLFVHPKPALLQHLRIYACAIANDSTGASLGASSIGSGLYQSDDTGKTWKHLGWNNIKCYSMDMLQSSNGRILYEATGLGVLRSTDYGEHWKQLTDWRISEVMDIAVNQKNPDEIWIATAHGPWRSEDGGKHWDLLLSGMKAPYCSRVLYDYHGYETTYLASEDGVYQTSKSNKIWIPITGPTETRQIVQEDSGFSVVGEDESWSFFKRHDSELLGSFPIYFHAWCTSIALPVYFGGSGQMLPPAFGGSDGLLELRKWNGNDTSIEYAWPGGPRELLTKDNPTPVNVFPPADVAACLDAGPYRIIGSLGYGVQWAIRNPEFLTFETWNQEKWKKALLKRQIWTLKDFLVTP